MSAIAIILIAIGAPLTLVTLALLVICAGNDEPISDAADLIDAQSAMAAVQKLMMIGAALLISGIVAAVVA